MFEGVTSRCTMFRALPSASCAVCTADNALATRMAMNAARPGGNFRCSASARRKSRYRSTPSTYSMARYGSLPPPAPPQKSVQVDAFHVLHGQVRLVAHHAGAEHVDHVAVHHGAVQRSLAFQGIEVTAFARGA